MIKRIHHVMAAVRDLEAGIARYRDIFGITPSRPPRQAQDGYWLVELPVGDTLLMLVAPGKPGDAVDRFLERRGEGLYSMGLEVEDRVALAQELQAKGVQMISPTFLHPKSTGGVLLELLGPGEE